MISEFPKWPFFDKDEVESATKILNSGKVNYWTGENGKNFEDEFAKYCNCNYGIALSNGTLALYLAYKSIGLREKDEFITTPRTFIATASTGVILGAKPIFADVDINSGCITAQSIEPKITAATKAIVVVHLGGWPADMESILDLAKSKNIKVIEDCSQAHGAKINRKSVGCFGDVSAWSFCQDKIMTTGGEGGMVSTNSKELYETMWEFKDHGKNRKKMNTIENTSSFKWVHDNFGLNFRLTEVQSSIGRIQLRKLEKWNALRNRNAMILKNILRSSTLLHIPEVPNNLRHGWYKFYAYIRLEALASDWNRDRILNEIKKINYPAFSGSCSEIYLEESFRKLNKEPYQRLANAKLMGETSIMFLIHPNILEETMVCYAKNILSVIKKATR